MGLRILHSIATVNPAAGGPVEGLRQISAINVASGHEVEVVTADAPDSPWVRQFPHPVTALGPGITRWGYSRRLVPWLRANAARFDAVVVNGIWGDNCFGVWRALRHTDTPYCVYPHGMLDPWFKYRYPLKHLKKWMVWPWAVYPVLRDAQAVLFTCAEERDRARDSFWLYDVNEVVVRYGTAGIPEPLRDRAAAFLGRHPALQGHRRLVFLGRVHPKKGVDLLFKALARLRDEGLWQPARMRLVLAGPSEGVYAGQLVRLAQRLGIADSIHWTGMLQGDDKWGALQCAEAFVLPSHQENFGVAVAEALSAGVPVLLSRSVNIWREIVADGAGWAEADTVEGCTRLLRRWLQAPAPERAQMGERARTCYAARFTAHEAAMSMASALWVSQLASRCAFQGDAPAPPGCRPGLR
jgi:glycosyltransferase involved in cell wall biosynthesis